MKRLLITLLLLNSICFAQKNTIGVFKEVKTNSVATAGADTVSVNSPLRFYRYTSIDTLRYGVVIPAISVDNIFEKYGLSIKPKDTALSLRIGSAGNYAILNSEYGFLAEGRATSWEDSQVPPLGITVGVTAPSLTPGFRGNAALQTYYFQGGGTVNDQCWFSVQFSHSMQEYDTLHPHVHWAPTTNVASGLDTVVWELVYSYGDVHSVFDVADTLIVKGAGGANNQWGHMIADLGIINGKKISSILVCRLRRLNSDASDTYGGDAAFLGFDVHYKVNTFGSREQITK